MSSLNRELVDGKYNREKCEATVKGKQRSMGHFSSGRLLRPDVASDRLHIKAPGGRRIILRGFAFSYALRWQFAPVLEAYMDSPTLIRELNYYNIGELNAVLNMVVLR